jgi:thiol-disulfide isomerase/thioredoxin
MTSMPHRGPSVRPRRSRAIVAMLASAVVVGALAAILVSREGPAAAEETAASDFAVALYGGHDSRGDGSALLSDYHGSPVIVNFWAVWCPPCRVEMPALQDVYRRFEDEGLVVVGADVGPFGPGHDLQATRFLADAGATFPAGRVDLDVVTDLYRLSSLPTTVFIRRDGTVHGIWVGFIDERNLIALAEEITAQ